MKMKIKIVITGLTMFFGVLAGVSVLFLLVGVMAAVLRVLGLT